MNLRNLTFRIVLSILFLMFSTSMIFTGKMVEMNSFLLFCAIFIVSFCVLIDSTILSLIKIKK